jgi:hypothetical protein
MKTLVARAALCLVVCSSLTGCGTTAGRILGGLAAATAAQLVTEAVASAIDSAARGDRANAASTPVAAPPPPSYPGDEDPALLTCEAKRREFLSVYHETRKLPRQLECSADGAFGDAAVHGGSSPRLAAAE